MGEAFEYSTSRAESVDLTTYVGVENLRQGFAGRVDSTSVPVGGSLKKFVEGDILLGNIRPYLRKLWLADRSGGASPDVLVFTMQEKFREALLPSFVFHYLCREHFFSYLAQHSRGGKMPRGDKKAILKYRIPIPSLEVQERVVEVLERFDALANDLSSGLPAEIEARRKQYEYYRDKLLSFPEKQG